MRCVIWTPSMVFYNLECNRKHTCKFQIHMWFKLPLNQVLNCFCNLRHLLYISNKFDIKKINYWSHCMLPSRGTKHERGSPWETWFFAVRCANVWLSALYKAILQSKKSKSFIRSIIWCQEEKNFFDSIRENFYLLFNTYGIEETLFSIVTDFLQW